MRSFIFVVALLSGLALRCQDRTLSYIESVRGMAVRESMEYCIPASIILGQAILESGSGISPLAKEANNHFGIKCAGVWKGGVYRHDDDRPGECFRKYNSIDESFRDHSLFLARRPRYESLFLLGPTDYRGWAIGLQKSGYATNPKYASLLIKCIEKYGLYRYDVR